MTAFHPFPRLPYELRAMIWKLTVEPRIVDVRVKRKRSAKPYGVLIPYLVSLTPVPAVLHACREARSQGLYQQAFSEIAGPDGAERRYVWANLEMDMISIGTTLFDEYEPVAPLIRRLKFEREHSDDFFFYREVHRLRDFLKVREVHVVCADGLRSWHLATEEHYWPCGKQNVFMIDPDDGRMMRGIEMDEMFDRELEEYENEHLAYWLL